MNDKLFGIIIVIVGLSLVFRHQLKTAVELLLQRRVNLVRYGFPYGILVLFAVFVIVTTPPPWSLPPLAVTAYAILGHKTVANHRLFHLLVGIVAFGVGVALFEGVIGSPDVKNEIYLMGHYLDINCEIGPVLFLSAVPIMFSAFWQSLSLHLMGRRPR